MLLACFVGTHSYRLHLRRSRSGKLFALGGSPTKHPMAIVSKAAVDLLKDEVPFRSLVENQAVYDLRACSIRKCGDFGMTMLLR